MRYATKISERAPAEQDPGRAFGYREKASDLPIIIVGTGCFRQLSVLRKGRRGLLVVNPDVRMQKKRRDRWTEGISSAHPLVGEEFDTKSYRGCWEAAAHFDKGRRGGGKGCDNPRRFLLFGRPQIGKTGAFLHLIYLLHKKVHEVDTAPRPEPKHDAADDDDTPLALKPCNKPARTPKRPRASSPKRLLPALSRPTKPPDASPECKKRKCPTLEEIVQSLGPKIYDHANPKLQENMIDLDSFRDDKNPRYGGLSPDDLVKIGICIGAAKRIVEKVHDVLGSGAPSPARGAGKRIAEPSNTPSKQRRC